MKALVTGAGGFIGGFLCRDLVERGVWVRALALPGEKLEHLEEQGIEICRGDLTEPASLAGLADGVDTVFHLAGRVTDWGPRRLFYSAILDATRNLLDICAGKVERFVYFSSVCACGMGSHLAGHTEADPVRKSGVPYNDAKLEAEQLVWRRHAAGDLTGTVIRPTNVTGPGSVWVRDIVERFRGGSVPLIDGGRHSASLIYVENLVDGVILAASAEIAGGRTYHFRDDWKVTWREYISALGAMVGKRPAMSIPFRAAWPAAWIMEHALTPFNIRPPVTRHTVGIIGRDLDIDSTRARQELGWRTRVPYAEAMARIADWVAGEYTG